MIKIETNFNQIRILNFFLVEKNLRKKNPSTN